MKTLFFISFVVLTLTGCLNSDEEDIPKLPDNIYRPDNGTCLAHEPPVLSSSVKFEKVYPGLTLGIPIDIYRMPGNTEYWYMIDRAGYVYKFKDDPNVRVKDELLDISGVVDASYGELGLLGMAFHPDFSVNNKVYLYYSYINEDNERYATLSEFTYDLAQDKFIDEVSIINLRQFTKHHQGGNVMFGPDGYLYLGYGDDAKGMVAQELTDLYGKIIRIDVPGDGSYTIPEDNPFVDVEGARGEIYARGFRNPWRWSIDFETGELWLGDVGASNLEEVDHVVKGGNYGWPIKEGTSCMLDVGCDDQEDLIDPILEYSHDAGWGAIIGGAVYRGTDNPGLAGRYIFADFSQFSQILSLEYDVDGQPFGLPLFEGKLASGGGIHSFTSDLDGELYVTHFKGIFKMVPGDDVSSSAEEFPQLLSETGCFANTANGLEAVESAIPYSVASPLYTDGAAKKRWMAIPDDRQIDVLDNGDFIFPVGSVLIKEFSMGETIIETRLLMKNDTNDWAGYTYHWNDEQTDAVLLPAGKTVPIDGINYQIPSRIQCQSCHNDSINGAIGPEYRQLNFDHEYTDGITGNQIEYLTKISFLKDEELSKQEELTALPDYHLSDFTNTERMDSFVHSNCSFCHNPEGTARGSLDFRWQEVPLWNACNKEPEVSSLDIEDAKLIAPGQPEKSIIYKRLNTTELYRMPAIGRTTIQHDVVELLENYINEVECN